MVEVKKTTVGGPRSRCPECLMDFIFGKVKCSGCDNDYEGWYYIINRDKIFQKMIPTEYFICPACKNEVLDITFDFNGVEDRIIFQCPSCETDLQVEPPIPDIGMKINEGF